MHTQGKKCSCSSSSKCCLSACTEFDCVVLLCDSVLENLNKLPLCLGSVLCPRIFTAYFGAFVVQDNVHSMTQQ